MSETNPALDTNLELLHQQVLKLIKLQLEEDKVPNPPDFAETTNDWLLTSIHKDIKNNHGDEDEMDLITSCKQFYRLIQLQSEENKILNSFNFIKTTEDNKNRQLFDPEEILLNELKQYIQQAFKIINPPKPTREVNLYPFKTIKGKGIEQSARRIETCCFDAIISVSSNAERFVVRREIERCLREIERYFPDSIDEPNKKDTMAYQYYFIDYIYSYINLLKEVIKLPVDVNFMSGLWTMFVLLVKFKIKRLRKAIRSLFGK